MFPNPIATSNVRATPARVDTYADRVQAEADARAEAEEPAIERASAEVAIDDVINAMAELPEAWRTRLMNAYLDKKDRAHFVYLLELFFDDAFAAAAEGIAKRKGY